MSSNISNNNASTYSSIESLARPSILKLRPYQSARSVAARSFAAGDAPLSPSENSNTINTVYLDANESPYSTNEIPLNRYPDPQPAALKNRMAELYNVPAHQLLIGRGADEAIDLLVRVFCEPGKDRILICPPTYGMYEVSAQIQDVEICRVPLKAGVKAVPAPLTTNSMFSSDIKAKCRSSFQLDFQGIVDALMERRQTESGDEAGPIKLIFICSPNNPTGTAFDLDIIYRICEAAMGRAIVVVDEAYAEFHLSEGGRPESVERPVPMSMQTNLGQGRVTQKCVTQTCVSMLSEISRFPNLVVLRTLSKAWAMAGVRCGVAIAQEPLVQLLQKVRAPYPLSYPSIQAAWMGIDRLQEEVLRSRIATIRRERERLVDELSSLPSVEEIFPTETNFILVKFKNAKEVMTVSRAQGIVLRDRSSEPGLDGCIRITVGSKSENAALISVLRGRQQRNYNYGELSL